MLKKVLVICLFITKGFSLEYAITAKREKNPKIREIKVFSERCSGSTYFERLLLKNLRIKKENQYRRNLRLTKCHTFANKHFLPWFFLTKETYLGPTENYSFSGNEKVLFIVIFRNPYEWLQSFHKNPWHIAPHLYQLPFEQFIRAPFEADENDEFISSEKKNNPFLELNPKDGKPFANVMKLRTEKIKNMFFIQDFVENIYYVNYETVRKHPEKVVREVADYFGLNVRKKFQEITEYKGNKYEGEYKRKKYPEIEPEDLTFINSQLDEDVERSIGYTIMQERDV